MLESGGSGKGRARVVACQELTQATFAAYFPQRKFHGVETMYQHTWAFWLVDVEAISEPVQFFKPWGPVAWGPSIGAKGGRGGCAAAKKGVAARGSLDKEVGLPTWATRAFSTRSCKLFCTFPT